MADELVHDIPLGPRVEFDAHQATIDCPCGPDVMHGIAYHRRIFPTKRTPMREIEKAAAEQVLERTRDEWAAAADAKRAAAAALEAAAVAERETWLTYCAAVDAWHKAGRD